MKTYDEMIKQAASILDSAIHGSSAAQDEYYAKAEGYAEAITLMFDASYQETWDRIYDESEKNMLRKVENGDRRSKTRWDMFWGLNDYFVCGLVNR